MRKKWYPEQNRMDSSIALLKNFVLFTSIPISKDTIEMKVRKHREYPSLSLYGIEEILTELGFRSVTYHSRKMEDISSPSILFINDLDKSLESGEFVIFHKIEGNKIEYLHTRKGWVIEKRSEFSRKWSNVTLSLTDIISPNGEEDFQEKEELYNRRHTSLIESKKLFIKDDFLTHFECDYIIKLSRRIFKRSMVTSYNSSSVISDSRTSYSAHLLFPEDKILKLIEQKVSDLLNIPTSHFEYFQCVSYKEKQEFENHYDTFDETTEKGKRIVSEGGQRKFTVLAYLNDDFEGGSTHFPYLDLLIEPKKGRIVVFKNLHKNGKVVLTSIHAGLPVTYGRKYALNIWVRNKPFR